MNYLSEYGSETDFTICRNKNTGSSFFTALRLEDVSNRQAMWEEACNEIAKEKFTQQRKELTKIKEIEDEELRFYTLADYPFEEGVTIIVNSGNLEKIKGDLLKTHSPVQAYTMYKRVDKKVKPVMSLDFRGNGNTQNSERA